MARPRTNPYPRTLQCVVTGREVMVGRQEIEKRIAKAGSLENLQKTYICADARRELRKGKSIDEVRKQFGATINKRVPAEAIERYVRIPKKAAGAPRRAASTTTTSDVPTDELQEYVEDVLGAMEKVIQRAVKTAPKGLAHRLKKR